MIRYARDTSVQAEVVDFIAGCRTVVLATLAADDGFPDASYSPFIERHGMFYVLISQLAQHTRNLIKTPFCHALFISDETSSVNIYARKRVSFRCRIVEQDRSLSESNSIIDQMAERFGPTVGMIRSLGDFRLFELIPSEGLFVRAFGQAIPLSCEKVD